MRRESHWDRRLALVALAFASCAHGATATGTAAERIEIGQPCDARWLLQERQRLQHVQLPGRAGLDPHPERRAAPCVYSEIETGKKERQR